MRYPILMSQNAEMVPNLSDVVETFKRVSIHNHVESEGWNANQIADFVKGIMENSSSVLIILNTKTAVKKLYQALEELEIAQVVHLSTSMCPAHRKEQLEKIKSKLGKERIICVSTQLIEAGVDISFESVVRSLAGLDSIAQAAGRCNRNGELKQGNVYIIRAQDEKLDKLPEIRIGGEVTANYILSNVAFADHLLSPKAIETYFTHFDAQAMREVRKTPKGFDHELITLLDGSYSSKRPATKSYGMFKTLEQYFEAISSATKSVLVPFGKGTEIIASLNEDLPDSKQFHQLLKEAQQYSVNVYDHELCVLNEQGLIAPLYSESIFCLHAKAYHPQYGVTVEGRGPLSDYNY